MKLKINKIDIIILLVVVILMMSFTAILNYRTSIKDKDNLTVEIKISGKVTHVYNLEDNQIIVIKKSEYPVLLDDMEIEIKDKKVRVKKEHSPLNYCSKQGWVDKMERPIICLPNEVIIVIKGSLDFDWVMPS